MQPMTPEERFTKIENALLTLTEMQPRHDNQIEHLIAHGEKQNAGIRDLIIVSRTLVESQQRLEEMQRAMMDATFRAIDRLTDNIDKLIRGRRPNGQV